MIPPPPSPDEHPSDEFPPFANILPVPKILLY